MRLRAYQLDGLAMYCPGPRGLRWHDSLAVLNRRHSRRTHAVLALSPADRTFTRILFPKDHPAQIGALAVPQGALGRCPWTRGFPAKKRLTDYCILVSLHLNC